MNNNLRVGSQRIVSIRYRMKNSDGQVLIDTFEGEPVKFRYGSGEILAGLEGPLTGLKAGEETRFSLRSETTPQLDQNYHFEVIVDNVPWATDSAVTTDANDGVACGSDCDC